MLSILIPIYNFNVTNLILELVKQANKSEIDYEIRCYEDGSTKFLEENKLTSKADIHIIYKTINPNIGRQKIRSLLANEAKYSKLLFIDCDNIILNDFFLQSYIEQDNLVVYGGRNYPKHVKRKNCSLHYKYGMVRESIPASKRSQNPFRTFLSTNFLIHKDLYLSIPYFDGLKGYGYEDTFIGSYLKNNNIPITHIDNPATHTGLEKNEIILEKTENATINLSKLYKDKMIEPKQVKALMVFHYLKKFKVNTLVNNCLSLIKSHLKNNLLSEKPSLFYYDLYKLYLLTVQLK